MKSEQETGGDEAALFAGDLLRMYNRFCVDQGWKFEVIEGNETELGGYKEAIINVKGFRSVRTPQI